MSRLSPIPSASWPGLPVTGPAGPRGVTSSAVRDILALTQRPGVISFAGGLPANELFDVAGLRAAFAFALSDDGDGARALQYSTSQGDPRLRAAVAARLSTRGLPTDADDLLITSGSQQALTLIATVLVSPGDRVLVEEPSYLAALQCFALAGAVAVPVPCDEDGLDPAELEQLIAAHRPVLLYTVPTFHNPTGRTLTAQRREALAAVIERADLWLVEDDPYSELRYAGQPLAPVAALPGAKDRTLAISTLSKVVAPGLRLGWVRAPQQLLAALTVAKQATDLHSSTIDQAAAAYWLANVDLDAHVARLCHVYRTRRDALLADLPAALPAGSSHNSPDGGMFVWARLPEGWDATALLPVALAHDVAYVPGAPFFSGPSDAATLRLSFTAHGPAEIRTGLARLSAALATGAGIRSGRLGRDA